MMFNNENAAPSNVAKAGGGKKSKEKTIEETYTKKTQLEHILIRPDTYIGSIEKQTQQMWVYDVASKQVVHKNITYTPGLYKIYDEIIVNAADNKQRDPTMDRIEVTINPDDNSIRIWNNGKGIPIVMHAEHKIYVPELIFGNLLTGSNFDDDEEKTTGGRNGYGAKLANIFSTEFVVETADSSRGLKYKQSFRDNMGVKGTPDISKYSGKDFTCVTFYPDLARFKMVCMDEDIVALFCKRAYDIAATNTAAGTKLNVYLNGNKIETRNFESYIAIHQGLDSVIGFEKINDRWEIGVGISDGSFTQVSYVNSICTSKGGCHVNYIADQITKKLEPIVKKKNKGQEVKPNQIKNHLSIFVNALITNPAFDSQTKETLTTKVSSFGSTCVVTDRLIKQLEKSNLIDNILSFAKIKQNNELKRKGGSKRAKLFGIPKLDDANYAGTSKSKECTLILTEGDSAKALAISGLGVVGRDYYGVFPLKGKLLNVREALHNQILKNDEIQNIVKILGLTFGKEYTETSSLRYGHLMIMTDQDHDGSHIKGLLINFIHVFWPSLLKIDGFLQQFITPIVKCTKGSKIHIFYTIPQYHNWKDENHDAKGWKIKYYKGLGTSTSAEAKDYFSNLQTHEIDFKWQDSSANFIELAFAKARVNDRKLWLLGMQQDIFIDYDVDAITYDDFVNQELILFSHADNERSIPHFMDGLKPSQRKVLFGCFKRNLKNEIKVAQLAGYISEQSAYHHGEASLTQTIVAMAQNFTGSNNINLLSPCGQFGTRLMGGKDAASARYIFTKLETITRNIFHPSDDPLLSYLDDDGQSIEPATYVPVIPMVLVNGSEGIGTGWSTSVPTYNPRDVINNLRSMIKGQACDDMKPWFRGFTGDVERKGSREVGTYIVSGVIEQVDEQTIIISELPVGKWTTDYKQFLETMVIGAEKEDKEDKEVVPSIIQSFKENHTDTAVSFTLTMPPEKLSAAMEKGIYKVFKLDTSVSTTNMHMFDMHSQIRKYETPLEIMRAFFDVRIDYYDKRKYHLMMKLKEEWERLDNKVKFITNVCNSSLVVSNRKKNDLLTELKTKGYKSFVDAKKAKKDDDDALDEDNDMVSNDSLDKGYDYLLSMKIWSLTMEKVNELVQQRDGKKSELDTLACKSPENLWLEDLNALEHALDDFDQSFEDAKSQEAAAQQKASRNAADKKGGRKSKKSSKYDSDDSDGMGFDDESDYDSDVKPKKKAVKAAPVVSKLTAKVTTKVAGTRLVNTAIVNAAVEKPVRAPKALKPEKTSPPVKVAKATITAPVAAAVTTSSTYLSLAERLAQLKGKTISSNLISTLSSFSAPMSVDDEPISTITSSRAPRTTKAVTKKIIDYSDDEEGDDFSGADSDVFSDELGESESDFDDYASDNKKSKKTNAIKSTKAVAPVVVHKKVLPSTQGTKRAPKQGGGAIVSSKQQVYSPDQATPKVTKKQKKVDVAKPKVAKKVLTAKVSKKTNFSDDEVDSNGDDSEVEEVLSKRTPKPSRLRKTTNYTAYLDEDSEGDGLVDSEEYSDDE